MCRKPKQFPELITMAYLFFFLTSAPLHAQNAPAGHWVHDPSGIATDGFVYDAPPAGFDPMTATDAEIEQYGLPPRPTPRDMVHLARWQRHVTAPRVEPTFQFTNVYVGPAGGVAQNVAPNGESSGATSENWSGYVDWTTSTPPFAGNNSSALGTWVIPTVTQGICSSTVSWVVQWVGFDGFVGSTDVLQAGSQEISQNCKSNVLDYATWYEWYPNAMTNVAIGVRKGDTLGMEVWYTTSSPHGHALFYDGTIGKGTTIGFNPPGGTTYVGNSVEWIVERPTDSGLTNLADFGTQTMQTVVGEDGLGGLYWPESSEDAYFVNFEPLSMVCPPWNPSSACPVSGTVISQVGPVTDVNNFTVQAEPPAAP
jgi:hypothetical protein